MNQFHVGQEVWIGYTQDRFCRKAPEARCRYGTIAGGPFSESEAKARNYTMRPRPGATFWAVDIGREVLVIEKLLFPRDDREVCVDDCLELTE